MKFSLNHSIRWSTAIAVITLVLAAIFSILSSLILSGVSLAIGILVVFIIVLIGIVFDAIGLSAAAANEVPFHSMAAEKVLGAREAINICRNADRFSSFCNDVIGDISGIISGTASTLVVIQLVLELNHQQDSTMHYLLTVVFTSVVAALTVGGKAFGKSIAIHHATPIILFVGRIFFYLEHKFHIKIFNGKPKKNKKPKASNGKK
jgi:CBS domain containing-hemolysin-like protein